MSNFKIGEKVVAKDLSSSAYGYPFGIEKGEIYEVESVYNCSCGSEMIRLLNINSGSLKYCGNCNKYGHNTNSFHSWRFRKLDTQFAEDLCKELIQQVKKESLILSN